MRNAIGGTILASLAALGAAVIGFGLRCAPLRFTPDSFSYYAVAKGLLAGHGFTGSFVTIDSAIPRPLDLWPPGYPLAWAAGLGAGLPSDGLGIAIGILSFVALTGAFIAMRPAQAPPGSWAFLVSLLALLYPPFQYVAGFAWSEPMGMALLGVVLALEVRGADRSASRSLVAGVVLAAAALTRHAAILALPAMAMARAFAFLRDPPGRRQRVTASLSLAAGFVIVHAPWSLRAWRLFGTLTGMPHAPRSAGLAESNHEALKTLGGPGSFYGLGILAIAWLLVRALRARRGAPGAGEPEAAGWIALALFPLVYSGGVLYLSTRYQFDAVGLRYLAPIGVAVVPITARILRAVLARFRPAVSWAAIAIALGAVGFGLREPYRERGRPAGLAQVRAEYAGIVDWIERDVTPRDLLMGRAVFDFVPFTDAVVLTDGYPDHAFIDEGNLGPYLERHRGGFERFFWIGADPPLSRDRYELSRLPWPRAQIWQVFTRPPPTPGRGTP